MKLGCVRLVLVLAALMCGCGAAPPAPVAAKPPAAAPTPAPEPPLFEFHSGFWLNLHLWLHHAATAQRPPPPDAPAPPNSPLWSAAVDFYKQRFGQAGGMGLLFDIELVGLSWHLSQLGSPPKVTGVEIAHAAHFEATAQLVRGSSETWDHRNRAWINALRPALDLHGDALLAELEAVFQERWPRRPVRVDVSCFAGPVGAYTVINPMHIVVSSCNPAYQGEAALEMIFHEASHALIFPIEKKLEDEAWRQGRKVPDDLWHAVLFYSTGEIVRRRLGPGYVPYATKNGLWTRWGDFEAALRRDWQPYLDHRVELDDAIKALIDGLAEPAVSPENNQVPVHKGQGVHRPK